MNSPLQCDILIADDSHDSREILRAMLRNLGPNLEIREVRDGNQAVAACAKLRPKVTFLDIDMPELDGLTALQRIRAAQANAFIAIVSGRSSPDNVKQALSTGASSFVVKPFNMQRIIEVLERYHAKGGPNLVAER